MLLKRARASATPQENSVVKETLNEPSEPLAQRPLQILLLDAFDSQSLEQGLHEWEVRYGIDQELRQTVREVQRLYYGKEKIKNVHLQQAVHAAVIKIHAALKSAPASSENAWRPESFTPRY